MSTDAILRPSARVILIGPGGRTLLFRGGDPHRPHDGTWWFTPGGAVDPGETLEEAVRRELWEETGHSGVEWSDRVATREGELGFMGVTYQAVEVFYVAHTHETAVAPGGLTEIEEETIAEHRWLDASDISRLAEPVYPSELAGVLPALAARRYPVEPWVWSW